MNFMNSNIYYYMVDIQYKIIPNQYLPLPVPAEGMSGVGVKCDDDVAAFLAKPGTKIARGVNTEAPNGEPCATMAHLDEWGHATVRRGRQ